MLLQANVQRPQPAKREEAVERRTRHAKAVGPPHELLMQRLVARDDSATNDIAVTVEVLRRRMQNEVRTELQRLLPSRRQESVVDEHNGPSRMTQCRDLLDIRNTQQRIARRLDPQQRARP